MSEFDLNKDDEKDFLDSMIENENYSDYEKDIPQQKNNKTYNDKVLLIVQLGISIASLAVFLKLGVNFLSSTCWTMAIFSLLFLVFSTLFIKDNANTNKQDKLHLIITPILLFAIGLVIIGIH